MRRGFLQQIAGVSVLLALDSFFSASAQTFPSKPIKLIVPFPAGGGTDVMARSLGEALSKELGQPVIVENKAGAGTVIGNDFVAKSVADGHTLLLNTNAIAIIPSLYPKLPYAVEGAFTPIILLGRAPNVAVVRANSPLQSAEDLLTQVRSKPGELTYGSAGNGTSTHLAAELLKNSASVSITHVPYRGAAPMVTDLLAGQIDFGFATLPSVAPFIANGKLRTLGVTTNQRSPLLPSTPTFAESGVAGYEADVWYGVFAPASLPPPVLQTLHAAFRKACGTENFQRRAAAEGLVLTLDTPDTTEKVMRAEQVKWRRVVQAQSIKLE